jgi:hypothetical protein
MIIFVATTVNYCKDCIGKLLRLRWIVAIETGIVVPREIQTDIIESRRTARRCTSATSSCFTLTLIDEWLRIRRDLQARYHHLRESGQTDIPASRRDLNQIKCLGKALCGSLSAWSVLQVFHSEVKYFEIKAEAAQYRRQFALKPTANPEEQTQGPEDFIPPAFL